MGNTAVLTYSDRVRRYRRYDRNSIRLMIDR